MDRSGFIRKGDFYSTAKLYFDNLFGSPLRGEDGRISDDHPILEIASPLDNGLFSALGGRICYSKESPLKILQEDKRVTDFDERLSYLKRIANKHHFSIFAHSPSFIENSVFPSPVYKSFPIYIKDGSESSYYYNIYNLRHIVEIYGPEVLEYLIKNEYESRCEEIIDDARVAFKRPDGGVEIALFRWSSEDELNSLTDRYILYWFLGVPRYGWIVAIAHGYSRVFTHQLVRHTFFNFSQRSFRFTKTFGLALPDTLKPLFEDPDFECAQTFDKCYYELLEMGYKREDARYLYPMGAKTTIMFSGPLFVFEDFVNKRLDKAAQAEIREVAEILNTVLSLDTLGG